MTLLTVLLAVVAAVFGCIAIEKKRRREGTLTYPLWQCNLWVFWMVSALICMCLIGGGSLPRFVGLWMHNAQAQAVVKQVIIDVHCHVTYEYKAGNVTYTDSDGMCGLKAKDVRPVYYDALAPGNSTLYPPATALDNELIAIMLISLGLSALIVLWFRATHVIGGR
jgi:hypothetical protein